MAEGATEPVKFPGDENVIGAEFPQCFGKRDSSVLAPLTISVDLSAQRFFQRAHLRIEVLVLCADSCHIRFSWDILS
jgi:hypothetical protein